MGPWLPNRVGRYIHLPFLYPAWTSREYSIDSRVQQHLALSLHLLVCCCVGKFRRSHLWVAVDKHCWLRIAGFNILRCDKTFFMVWQLGTNWIICVNYKMMLMWLWAPICCLMGSSVWTFVRTLALSFGKSLPRS